MIFSLAACGQTPINENNEADSASNESIQTNAETDIATQVKPSEKNTETVEVPQEDGKTLIVYFSWSTSGNTEKMASYIQEQTNGDLLKIEPLNPYPT